MKWHTMKSILSLVTTIFPLMIFKKSLVLSIYGELSELSISIDISWLLGFLFFSFNDAFSVIFPFINSNFIKGKTELPIVVVFSLNTSSPKSYDVSSRIFMTRFSYGMCASSSFISLYHVFNYLLFPVYLDFIFYQPYCFYITWVKRLKFPLMEKKRMWLMT